MVVGFQFYCFYVHSLFTPRNDFHSYIESRWITKWIKSERVRKWNKKKKSLIYELVNTIKKLKIYWTILCHLVICSWIFARLHAILNEREIEMSHKSIFMSEIFFSFIRYKFFSVSPSAAQTKWYRKNRKWLSSFVWTEKHHTLSPKAQCCRDHIIRALFQCVFVLSDV